MVCTLCGCVVRKMGKWDGGKEGGPGLPILTEWGDQGKQISVVCRRPAVFAKYELNCFYNQNKKWQSYLLFVTQMQGKQKISHL